MVKTCSKCKTEKDIKNFKRRSGNRSHNYVSWCVECKQSYDRIKINEKLKDKDFANAHYAKRRLDQRLRKAFVENYLGANPCIKCGENDIEILDFDHRDRSEKEYSIAKMYSSIKSEKAIMAEIAKCDVLCGNCHRHKTMHENHSWRVVYCVDSDCPWKDL